MSEAVANVGGLVFPPDWSFHVECSGVWTLGVPIGRGESQPMHATRADGVRGVAKPALQAQGTPRAAHEKIAADLAKDLGLPVPPVILWTDQNTNERYSISAWVCRQPEVWLNQKSHLSEQFKQNCAQMIADISVFHTWIADTDRNDGNTLVDLESTETDPKLLFIDHAFCFTHNPAFNQPIPAKVVHSYYPQQLITQNMLANGVSLVEKMTRDRIEEIVQRVPLPYLSAERSEIIVSELLRRQSVLSSLFNV